MKASDAEIWKSAMSYVADWLEELFQEMGEDATELFLNPGQGKKNNVYDLIRNLRPDQASGGVSDTRIPKSEQTMCGRFTLLTPWSELDKLYRDRGRNHCS